VMREPNAETAWAAHSFEKSLLPRRLGATSFAVISDICLPAS
jgi:hypothetical protein